MIRVFSARLIPNAVELLRNFGNPAEVKSFARGLSFTNVLNQFPHKPRKIVTTPVRLVSPAVVNTTAKEGEPRFRPAKYKVDYLELYQPFFYQTVGTEDEVFEHHERIFHKLNEKVPTSLFFYGFFICIFQGPHLTYSKKNKLLDGKPFAKGVVLKTLIRKPKKPNSANRKCLRLRLSTGKEVIAKVPGIGHNLQEHNLVLVRGGRSQDLPGVKLKACRGRYDLQHTKKPKK